MSPHSLFGAVLAFGGLISFFGFLILHATFTSHEKEPRKVTIWSVLQWLSAVAAFVGIWILGLELIKMDALDTNTSVQQEERR